MMARFVLLDALGGYDPVRGVAEVDRVTGDADGYRIIGVVAGLPGRYVEAVSGIGLVYDADGFPIGGTVTSARITIDGVLGYRVTGLSLDLSPATRPFDFFTGNDTLIGNGFDNLLHGYAGEDRLFGGAGDDTLLGGAGRDRLFGGDGRDVLSGGTGPDVLTGGTGADVFLFETAHRVGKFKGRDVITDFRPGVDKIDMSGIDADPDTDGKQDLAFVGAPPAAPAPGEIYLDGDLLVARKLDGTVLFQLELILKGNTPLSADDFIL
jgi:hypothetical protein